MNFDNDIETCLSILHSGGVILYPTDTIWGLGCDATNEQAVEKIIQLKKRAAHKSFVVLLSDENVLANDGSVAIRICKDEFCKTLIKRFRKPIVSTSANISNEPSPKNFSTIPLSIKKAVDYVVIHRQNEQTETQPSSIIKWINGEVEVIR